MGKQPVGNLPLILGVDTEGIGIATRCGIEGGPAATVAPVSQRIISIVGTVVAPRTAQRQPVGIELPSPVGIDQLATRRRVADPAAAAVDSAERGDVIVGCNIDVGSIEL